MKLIIAFIVLVLVMMAGDGLWFGLTYNALYVPAMGDLLATKVNFGAALGFYVLYALGLAWLIVLPALTSGGKTGLVLRAAVFGLVAYATYDLTGLAVLRNWPLVLSLIDMAWGAVISLVAALAARLVLKKLKMVP